MQPTLLGSRIVIQLHQATHPLEGNAMRALRFDFHPERVRISAEEILADLRYPIAREAQPADRKRAGRRKGRR